MISRRRVIASGLGVSLAALAPFAPLPARGEPILTDDGLYRQPWFLESFLELRDDIDSAARSGKRLVVLWELRGCPYCKETHFVNFARPEIEAYVKERFEVLQLNIVGAREVTDVDGEKLTEKALAQKYGVRFTPTFQFFPDNAAGLSARKPRDREVARAQGYLEPKQFLALFKFVADRAYEKGSLHDFLKTSS